MLPHCRYAAIPITEWFWLERAFQIIESDTSPKASTAVRDAQAVIIFSFLAERARLGVGSSEHRVEGAQVQ